MKLPYTPAGCALLPRRRRFGLGAEAGSRGGSCRFLPPPSRSRALVSQPVSAGDKFAPAGIGDQSESAGRQPRERRTNSNFEKRVCAPPQVWGSPKDGCSGRRSLPPGPKGVPNSKGVPLTHLAELPVRCLPPGDPPNARAPRWRGAGLTCALTGEPMLEKESAGEW